MKIIEIPPALTVSIVTFRTQEAMLREALVALRKSAVPTDITIVDQTPEPDYFERLSTLEGVRLVRSPRNGGYGFGNNIALKHSPKAPYHLVMNPDVFVREGCLETLVAVLESHEDVVLAVPKVYFPDDEHQALNKLDPNVLDLVLRRFVPWPFRRMGVVERRFARFVMAQQGYDKVCDVPFASGCFMMFRRDALDKIGGFDERFFMYFEDADISRRVRKLGRIQYCPDAVITHAWSRGTHNNSKLTVCACVSAYRYFKKWGWQWS